MKPAVKFDYAMHRAQREVLRSKDRLNELPSLLAIADRLLSSRMDAGPAVHGLAQIIRDAATAATAAQTAAENAYAALKSTAREPEAQVDIAMSISSSSSAVDSAADVVTRAVSYLSALPPPSTPTPKANS